MTSDPNPFLPASTSSLGHLNELQSRSGLECPSTGGREAFIRWGVLNIEYTTELRAHLTTARDGLGSAGRRALSVGGGRETGASLLLYRLPALRTLSVAQPMFPYLPGMIPTALQLSQFSQCPTGPAFLSAQHQHGVFGRAGSKPAQR